MSVPAEQDAGSTSKQKSGTRKRANGIAAREKILHAAAEIAAERGYEGTSISLVSKRSGLPASSIYWHFQDKDDLIAAVIEQSFEMWLQALTHQTPLSEADSLEDFVTLQARQATRAIEMAPDFLRLGLMLALEHRPEDPTARKTFLKIRSRTFRNAVKSFATRLPELNQHDLEALASFTIAIADGFFISRQVADDTHDLMGRYELQAAAILGVIRHLQENSA